MSNLFVTNLSDIRNREGKILKKHFFNLFVIYEVSTASQSGRKFPKRKELKY